MAAVLFTSKFSRFQCAVFRRKRNLFQTGVNNDGTGKALGVEIIMARWVKMFTPPMVEYRYFLELPICDKYILQYFKITACDIWDNFEIILIILLVELLLQNIP